MKPGVLVVQFVLLSAGSSACAEATSGPCFVDYQSPVFEVRKVVNASSGGGVAQIRFRSFNLTRNGTVVTQDIRSQVAGPYHGVTVATDGSTDLICDVSCGFGIEPGHFSMTVTAPGFVPKQLEYDVNFTSTSGGKGGCPLILSGPTKVDISLVPAP